jgi:hypothetical protein
MSKLGSVIAATNSHRQVYMPTAVTYAVDDAFTRMQSRLGTIYKIGATFNVDVVIADDLRDNGAALSRAVEDAKRAMMHEVFGEYKTALYEAMRMAMSEQGRPAAEVIASVLRNMEDDIPYEYQMPRFT